MRNDLTDITLVVDRSGSMIECRSDAEGGVNAFIEEQKKGEGEAVLTLIQFDTEYEFVHTAKPINDVPAYVLAPRGSTALLDAVGRAINEAGERLGKMPEVQRPGLVVVVIVTDGKENSSHEFSKQQIKRMIERQESEYKWQFTYLGANQDAFAEAEGIGIKLCSAAAYSSANVNRAFISASSNVGRMRRAAMGGQSVNNWYTDEERKSMS